MPSHHTPTDLSRQARPKPGELSEPALLSRAVGPSSLAALKAIFNTSSEQHSSRHDLDQDPTFKLEGETARDFPSMTTWEADELEQVGGLGPTEDTTAPRKGKVDTQGRKKLSRRQRKALRSIPKDKVQAAIAYLVNSCGLSGKT